MKTQRCRSCDAPIIWSINAETKRKAPIDAEPVEDGSIMFVHEPGQGGDPEYHVLTKTERAHPVTGLRYSNHFQTCKFARNHRKSVS